MKNKKIIETEDSLYEKLRKIGELYLKGEISGIAVVKSARNLLKEPKEIKKYLKNLNLDLQNNKYPDEK